MILSSTQIFGLNIENYISERFNCYQPLSFLAGYDGMVEGVLPIEIKASKPHPQKVRKDYYRIRWQFDVDNVTNPHCLVVLVCQCSDGLHSFYVPGYYLLDRQHVTITSHPLKYSGWLAKFLEREKELQNMLYITRRFDSRFIHMPI